jgi:endonuclease YncB( thermonuclease family)
MYLRAPSPLRPEVTHVFAAAPTDRYSRSVVEVIRETNINLALVQEGQAFVYRQYLLGCDAKAYLEAEERASRARLGV